MSVVILSHIITNNPNNTIDIITSIEILKTITIVIVVIVLVTATVDIPDRSTKVIWTSKDYSALRGLL